MRIGSIVCRGRWIGMLDRGRRRLKIEGGGGDVGVGNVGLCGKANRCCFECGSGTKCVGLSFFFSIFAGESEDH